jgi:Xaa-Pro aminopeptidase
MSGAENTAGAWAAYNISTDRKMVEGDLVLIELDTQVEGYWSDISRTFVVGRPSDRQKEVWNAVHDCQERTIKSLRVGAVISNIDATARAFLTDMGYGAHFPHHIGHGVGFAFHEVPYLDPPSRIAADWPIQAGMVLAIEPGVYVEGWGGIRLEDNIVITENGVAEYLSTADRSL